MAFLSLKNRPEPTALMRDLRKLALALGPAGVASVIQFIIFALTTRALGPESFGQLAVLFAVSIFLSPLCSLGADQTIVRTLARDPAAFHRAWGQFLALTLLGFPVIWLLATGVLMILFNGGAAVGLLAVAVGGEMLLARAMTAGSATLVARQRLVLASLLEMSLHGVRLGLAVVLFLVFGLKELEPWLLAIGLQGLITSVIVVGVFLVAEGRPKLQIDRADLIFGLKMTLGLLLHAGQTTLDRIVLSLVVTPTAVGVYAAGTRVQLIASLSILWAARQKNPGYFEQAAQGPAALRRYTFACVPIMAAVGAGAGLGMAALAVVLPFIIGADFAGVTTIGLIIACAAPLSALAIPAADALTALDRQGLRTALYALGCGLLLALIALGANSFGILGAAWAVVVSQALLTGVLWVVAVRFLRGAALTGSRRGA